MSPRELATYLDHSVLMPHARKGDVEQACREAMDHGFHGVCINGCHVEWTASLLEESPIRVIATVGFPLGAIDADAKRYETEVAIDNGAHEIDMVMGIGRLKDRELKNLHREIRDVVEAAEGRPVKVIIETALLNREEKVQAAQLVAAAGAHFVKTSTGFGREGALVDDVRLLRETLGDDVQVKAAGGIRDARTAVAMIEAGAARLGTSSSVAIIRGLAGAEEGPAPGSPDEASLEE